MSSLSRVWAAFCLLVSGLVFVLGASAPASAGSGTNGAPQVTLNPGGGQLADGSDGLRFIINSHADSGSGANSPGQDQLFYRNTYQYCCSAGAPMLNIGGTLFGQAGPAHSASDWSSLTVVSTSGSTSQGARTDAKGNASARLRYVASKGGLDYVMERTVTYTYPNDFTVDSYVFTIPEGNTEQVKFYLGGDAAPGSWDVGVGVMLTSPTRSVISVNPSSGIQFGFQEIGDSKPFDGARAANFYAPWNTVITGGDIEFAADANQHDAGLMMQWNLGSTPGTQSAAMRQFANQQGTNLKAGFDRTFAEPDEAVSLDAVIENTQQSARGGLGFTIDLPAGTQKAPGSVTNTCGGTVTTDDGVVTLADGSVAALANCVVSVPVSASSTGTYTLSSMNVSGLVGGLVNTVGTSSFFVPQAPDITTDALGALAVGSSTSQAIVAVGAPAPTFAVTAGSLPAGLELDEETGVISGTPRAAGAYAVTITATNSGGRDSQTYAGSVAKGAPGVTGTVSSSTTEYGTGVTLEASVLPATATGSVVFTSGDTELCRVSLPAGGCTTPNGLGLGTWPVTAMYSGDDNWSSRSVGIGSFDVSQASTTLSAELDRSETTYGTAVDVDVEVTPAAARGTVTVTSAGETLCTITLPAASCRAGAELEPGTHTIAASYSGDATHRSSTALAGTLTVTRAAPSPTSTDVTTVFGAAVDLALADLPDNATGSVAFRVDGEELCSYDVAEDTSCTVEHGLAVGDHPMQVVYSGDDRYEPVTRNATLTVAKVSTSITSPATLSGTYGVGAALSTSGLPAAAGGTVTVTSGGEELCAWTIGSATGCTLPANLPAGEHELLVSYSGDANHLGSDATATLTVERAASEIGVAGPIEVDRRTAPVVRIGGIPATATGIVTISNEDLGVVCSFDVAEADRCTGAELAPGSWPMTATYSGDRNHAGSTATFTVVVSRDATEVEPENSAPSTTYGESISIGFDNLPADATGTVSVTLGSGADQRELCSMTLPGERTCVVDSLPAGEHELTLTYSGDDVYAGSVATLVLTVDKAAVALAPGATLTSDGTAVDEIGVAGLPEDATGRVTVTMASPDARYATGPARVGVLAPAAGTVVCTFEAENADSCAPQVEFAPGTHTLAVDYAGDTNHLAAQGLLTLQVAAPDQGDTDTDAGPEDADEPAGDSDRDATDPEATDENLPDTGVSFGVALGLPIALALMVLGGFLARRGRERLV